MWIAVRGEAHIVVKQKTDIGVGRDIQIIDTWEKKGNMGNGQHGKLKGR